MQELPFASIANGYGYRDVFGVFQQLGGTCSLNPACYPAWLNESNATCKLTFTSGGGGYFCSTQLIATTSADETPYFSTANHCISSAAEATSAQFVFFNRSACTGGNSAGTTVSAADVTATSATSDCTLLMAHGALPTGVYWAGWTNTNPATGTASTGLHHPSGTAQAISFGSKNSGSLNCGSPQSNWNSLTWNSGITEGGSSGSAIYRNSDHKMYGVLTCGASSCSNPGGDDGYGRWDVAANSAAFSTLLVAGSDDCDADASRIVQRRWRSRHQQGCLVQVHRRMLGHCHSEYLRQCYVRHAHRGLQWNDLPEHDDRRQRMLGQCCWMCELYEQGDLDCDCRKRLVCASRFAWIDEWNRITFAELCRDLHRRCQRRSLRRWRRPGHRAGCLGKLSVTHSQNR